MILLLNTTKNSTFFHKFRVSQLQFLIHFAYSSEKDPQKVVKEVPKNTYIPWYLLKINNITWRFQAIFRYVLTFCRLGHKCDEITNFTETGFYTILRTTLYKLQLERFFLQKWNNFVVLAQDPIINESINMEII